MSENATVAVAYLRRSRRVQRYSLDAQRAAVERWADDRGVYVVAWHEDTLTGATDPAERPGLTAALGELMRLGATVLVVAHRDRVGRGVELMAEIERDLAAHGAQLVAVDDQAPEYSRFRVAMVDAFAEYERAMVSRRTSVVLQHKRSRGERVGAEPIGTRVSADGVHLVEHRAESEAVARIRELRAGGLSIRAIAARLDADGVPARGRRWHPTTVARVLASHQAA